MLIDRPGPGRDTNPLCASGAKELRNKLYAMKPSAALHHLFHISNAHCLRVEKCESLFVPQTHAMCESVISAVSRSAVLCLSSRSLLLPHTLVYRASRDV